MKFHTLGQTAILPEYQHSFVVMFTGLVEHMGTVSAITSIDSTESGGAGWSMVIGDAAPILTDCHLGNSILVNGACLTVTEFDGDSFKVGLAPETLSRTNLGDLKVGSQVNLERAMSIGGRYGGHFVQGHVDATAKIVSVTPDGNSIRLLFSLPESATEYLDSLIPKGYVCLDGTSLTLTSVDDDNRTFGVMLIAYTQSRVIITSKRPGDSVNVEFDVVAKTAAKIIRQTLLGTSQSGPLVQAVDAAVKKALSGPLIDEAVQRAMINR